MAAVARAFEAHLVPRFGVGHVELPVGGIDQHVEQHRADVRERRRSRTGVGASASICEHVEIGQVEAHGVGPVAAELVLPDAGRRVELDDQPDLRCRGCPRCSGSAPAGRRAPEPPGRPPGTCTPSMRARRRAGAAVAHRALADAVVWLPEWKTAAYTVLPSAVAARARGVSPNSSRIVSGTPSSVAPRSSASKTHTSARGVPSLVSSGRTRRGQVLAAPRRGDEGAGEVAVAVGRTGEDDVARLVADQQRAHDARRCRRDVDDADAVGEVIDHPHLVVGARRHRDRLEADRHRVEVRQPAGGDGEDLQPVVGGVRRRRADCRLATAPAAAPGRSRRWRTNRRQARRRTNLGRTEPRWSSGHRDDVRHFLPASSDDGPSNTISSANRVVKSRRASRYPPDRPDDADLGAPPASNARRTAAGFESGGPDGDLPFHRAAGRRSAGADPARSADVSHLM